MTKGILPIHPDDSRAFSWIKSISSRGESTRKLYAPKCPRFDVIFLQLVRYWFRFRRVDKLLKRMIEREKERERKSYIEQEKFDNVTPRERPRSIPIYLPVETRFIAAIARCNVRNTWSVSSISHGVELDFLKTYPIVWPRLAKSDSCLAFLFTVIQIISSFDIPFDSRLKIYWIFRVR